MDTRALAMAAAALTALGTELAQAVSLPEQAQISIKAMDYQDSQEGALRIRVKALSTQAILPVGASWSLEVGSVIDAISGASPAYYTAPQSFADVHDKRRAYDLKAAYHWQGQRLSLGMARSNEADYLSTSHLLGYAASTADNNTTLELGAAITRDTINPVTQQVVNQKKDSHDLLISLNRVLTPSDLVQVQWVHTQGRGYYSDPYKFLDTRPDHKRANAIAMRWNHHMPDTRTTARWSARATHDSFGIRSATLGLDLAQSLPAQWTLTPGVRFYSQSSARFFSPPSPSGKGYPVIPPDFQLGQTPISFDQRLAAYGALTWALKLEKQLTPHTQIDIKLDRYQQRNAWSLHGPEVTGLAHFKARYIQLGLTHRFGP